MSLEIKKGTSSGVNDFLLKRGGLIKHLILHEGSVDPQLAENVSGKLTNLQSVTVDGGVQDRDVVADEDLVALQRMCSGGSLAKVSLSHLNNVSISVVDNFLANFSSLTNLTLSYCSSFTDVSLANVASSCRNLRIISLRCTMIGDNGLSDLANHCSSLISADFGECLQITDAGICSVASRNKDLEELNVDNCPCVTETALVALATDCRNMRSISMEATGIRKLPSAVVCLGKLRALKLLGCKQLTHPCAADSEVVQQACTHKGFQQLLNYFVDYQLTYRIKVFVTGEPGVGKSALIKCLTENPLLVPQSSVGFSGVSLWDPSSLVSPGATSTGKFIFEIWELPDDIVGLGDIFYIESAIYIICFDLVEGGVDSVIRNILSVWAKFPNVCTIFLVGTHADTLDQAAISSSIKNIEEKLYQLLASRAAVAREFSNEITNIFGSENVPPVFQQQLNFLKSLVTIPNTNNLIHAVSCRSRQGINELRQSLIRRCSDHAAFFPQLSHCLTPALVQLYEDIRQLRLSSTVVLPWPEFAYFAQRAGITAQDVERDTRFLHNTGVIFDFRYLINSSTVPSSDSYICIDPSRFLELFNSIHSPNLSLPDENMSGMVERGQLLGRMLPSLWKISDTDQLELLERFSAQLGLICSNSAALPPASFDKSLPPLPLGAHRCAFIRRVYSLPLFYSRLQKISRPVHWQQLAIDDCQMNISFRLPSETIVIVESSFQRILGAIPSLYLANRGRAEFMLCDFDLSNGKMLLRFNMDSVNSDDSIEVLMCVSLSAIDGISVSARINKAEFSSNGSQPLTKASQVLWFYCTSVARNVYSRLTNQLSGVPLSICFTSKRSPDESASLSLPEMLAVWQNSTFQDQPVLQCPPVPYPLPSQFESLLELFDYLFGKLDAILKNNGLKVGAKSPIFHQPNSPKSSCVGDGIIVNDGCFRRGKSKKLSVQFLVDFQGRSTSDAMSPNYQSQQLWSPALAPYRLSYDSSARSSRTLPKHWQSPLHPDVVARGNVSELLCASCDARFAEEKVVSEEDPSEQDERDFTKDSLTDCLDDYTDYLSVLSSGSLPSLDSSARQRKQLYRVKRKRPVSPPPCRNPVSSPAEPSICLAKQEEVSMEPLSVLQLNENVQIDKAVQVVQIVESFSVASSSTVQSLNSPILLNELPAVQNQVQSVGSGIGEKLQRLPDTPLNESRPAESKLLSPKLNNKEEATQLSSTESSRSSPLVVAHSGGPSSVGGDSGLVESDENDAEKRKAYSPNQKQLSPENPVANGVENGPGKTVDGIEESVLMAQAMPDFKATPIADTSTAVDSPLSSSKRGTLRLSALLRRHKSEVHSDGEEPLKSPKPSAKMVSDTVARLVHRHRSNSLKSKKDRSKCLCS